MSKSIFSLGRHEQHLSRNAFDLSRKALLTAPSGALLPVFVQEVQPNDHLKIETSSFTRTAPLNSAAYANIKEQIDYFFVPFRLLWSYFPHMMSRTNDYSSMLLAQHMSNGHHDESKTFIPNGVPAISGEHLFIKFFDAPAAGSPSTSKPYYIGDKGDLFGIKYKYNAVRLLNLLGYGFDGIRVDKDGKRVFGAGSTSTSTPVGKDKVTDRSQRGSFGNRVEIPFDVFRTQSFNPLRLLAYQKIYNDFYRREDYLGQNVRSFNVDDMDKTINSDRLEDILQMRYLPLKRDYFTNVYPNNLWFGGLDDAGFAKGLGDKDLNAVLNYLGAQPVVGQSTDGSPFSGGVVAVAHQNLVTNDNRVVQGTNHLFERAITTASLRNAYAVEKLLTLMNVAGKNYNDQMRTRWGIKVHNDLPDHAIYLGSHNSQIQINEIVATSDSQNASSSCSLGEITGRGLGAGNSKAINFDAKEHGVVLGIYSNYSQTVYNSHAIDPFNFKFGFGDYYQPEFDNLGMQPLLASTVFNDDKQGDRGFIGWQPRYSEYKTALDKVYGGFQSAGSKSFWTTPLLVEPFLNKDGKTYRSVNIRDLSVNPHTLESIFAIQYDGTTDTDPFLVDLFFHVTKVSSMSVLGEPLIS